MTIKQKIGAGMATFILIAMFAGIVSMFMQHWWTPFAIFGMAFVIWGYLYVMTWLLYGDEPEEGDKQ